MDEMNFPPASVFELRLYIAGRSPNCVAALAAIQQVCEENYSGRYRLEVVDLLKQPNRAAEDQIVAVPTLVRRQPLPLRRLIGNLSKKERILAGLEVTPP